MKCAVCKQKIEETFLSKIKGTYINKKGVCSSCQTKFSVEEIKSKV